MTKWSDRTTYHGKRVNQGGKQIMAAANKMVRTQYFGGEREDITMTQGGYNKGGVSASAGTHDGGGAWDLTAHNWKNRVKVFRLLGVAMFDRPTIRGLWSHHIHGIVCGDGTASAGAKRQVTAYFNGRNGLANNAKDKDWRPSNLPILFKLDGDLRDRYCTTACHLYDEPAATDQRQSVKVGDKISGVVAVVNVDGKYWFITADGRCGYEDNFSTTKPATSEPEPKPVYDTTPLDAEWRVTKNGKWGTDGPCGDPLYERQAGYHLYTESKAVVGGLIYYVTAYGTWYSADHLVPWHEVTVPDPGEAPEPEPKPEPEPQPTPPKPAVADVRISTGNVNAGFDGATYDRRIPGIVKIHNTARSSVRFIQEADDRDDATDLCNAMGDQFRYTREQGRDSRLSASIVYDREKEDLLDSGRFDISGSTHDNATWALFEVIENGVIWFGVTTLLWPFPIGPNDRPADDKIRRDSMDSLCKQARAYTAKAEKKYGKKHIPIIVGGDLNHDKDDKPDAPGDAAAKYNFIDSDRACDNRINGDKATHARKGGLYVGGRIDRFLLDELGVVCHEQETINAYPHMDHNVVVISTSLSNE